MIKCVQSIRKQDDAKRNIAYRRRKLASGRNRKVIEKKNVTKSPMRGQKQFGKNAKNSLEKKSRAPEMEEQWQVIKSMRKRQEAALRSAEMEREEVRLLVNIQHLTKEERFFHE